MLYVKDYNPFWQPTTNQPRKPGSPSLHFKVFLYLIDYNSYNSIDFNVIDYNSFWQPTTSQPRKPWLPSLHFKGCKMETDESLLSFPFLSIFTDLNFGSTSFRFNLIFPLLLTFPISFGGPLTHFWFQKCQLLRFLGLP